MKKKIKFLGVTSSAIPVAATIILGIMAIPGAASATSITYNSNWAPTEIPFSSTPILSLPQFNTSLGILDSFSLELVANTCAGQITYTDTSGTPNTDVELLAVGATVTVIAPNAVTLEAIPMGRGSDPDLLAYDSYTVVCNSGTASDTVGPDSNPLDFGPYEGTGDFTVNVGAVLYQQLFTSGGSGTLTPSSEQTDGTVSVTYNFSPVPEPSPLVLLGCGLAILPFLPRQRQ